MADNYGNKLIRDLPQQFKGKERIEALLTVIGNQFDQVRAFYDSLNLERSLATAKGVHLDRIGEILVLSRLNAGTMYGKSGIIDDDLYRRLLIHKAILNFGKATYADIMNCINVILGENARFYYREDPNVPATIILEALKSAASEDVQNILEAPIPKAAGVGMRIIANDGAKLSPSIGITSHVYILKDIQSEALSPDEVLTFYTDESGNTLVDESENVLLCE